MSHYGNPSEYIALTVYITLWEVGQETTYSAFTTGVLFNLKFCGCWCLMSNHIAKFFIKPLSFCGAPKYNGLLSQCLAHYKCLIKC